MEQNKLVLLANDKIMLNQVRDYLFNYLQSLALAAVFTEVKDTKGLKEAGDVVRAGLDKLEAEFSNESKKRNMESSE